MSASNDNASAGNNSPSSPAKSGGKTKQSGGLKGIFSRFSTKGANVSSSTSQSSSFGMGNGASRNSSTGAAPSHNGDRLSPGEDSGHSERRATDGAVALGTMRIKIGDRSYTVQEIQRLIPDLEQSIRQKQISIDEKDSLLRKQTAVVNEKIDKIKQLEEEVVALKAACDKLRSVLDLDASKLSAPSPTTAGGPSPSSIPLLASPTTENAPPVSPTQISFSTTPRPGDSVGTGGGMRPISESLVGPLVSESPLIVQQQQQQREKKQGISAEPDVYMTDKIKLVRHKKSAGSKQLIRDAILHNDFLKYLDSDQVLEVVECMYERQITAGNCIIREGEAGAHLYVASEGDMEVSKGGAALGKLGPGKVFGELAILYNCTRTASVKAVTAVKVWVLDRAVFQMITMRLGLQRHETLMQFLRQVPLLQALPEDRTSKIADSLEQDFYAEGTYIVREGERGDAFFIILQGQVSVVQLVEGKPEPVEIRQLNKGDYFGERALLGEEVRTASVIALAPGVEVLTLDRESFEKLIGDIQELKNRDYRDEERGAKRIVDKQRVSGKESGYESSLSESQTPRKVPSVEKEFAVIEMKDLKTIATLGVGGFGRVELVCLASDKSKAFALKAMKKKHIVDTRQQEHIFSERNIMLELRSQFIVRLYKTYRDKKYVFMLLECCLGGELWTILRDRGHFDDMWARFYTACVIEALEYLHKRGIVYRDLKPENCLVDGQGYLKLVDFGFAKKLAAGRKTWTFCGTPEYVAPEIILNKGHDHSADFWAMGIYICELLLGRPPFQAQDPMKTYTLILKGIDALDLPNRRIGKTATVVVKKLCRDNPAERLGCQATGIEDIRKQRWFVGFDWDALRAHTLKPPFIPKVAGATDISNFDQYPADHDVPPDELSGWDEGF